MKSTVLKPSLGYDLDWNLSDVAKDVRWRRFSRNCESSTPQGFNIAAAQGRERSERTLGDVDKDRQPWKGVGKGSGVRFSVFAASPL